MVDIDIAIEKALELMKPSRSRTMLNRHVIRMLSENSNAGRRVPRAG